MIKIKIVTSIIDSNDNESAIYTDSEQSTDNPEELKRIYEKLLRHNTQMTFKALNNKDNLPMTFEDLKRIFPDLIS